jgi:pyrroloquinoline quinone biosynthesis protein B
VSADGKRWFLLNASPDVRLQLERSGLSSPPDGKVRGSRLQGVLLSNADLDHTLGLFILREGPRLPVYASASTRRALEEGLRLGRVLDAYAGIEWREPTSEGRPLLDRNGEPSGLSVSFLSIPGKVPRYQGVGTVPGGGVAMRIADGVTGKELLYAPGLADVDDSLLANFGKAEALLLDGTFFREDEMARAGVGTSSARDMGHLPVGGTGGSLERIRSLPIRYRVYVHINNTNPMLDDRAAERAQVEASGVVVGQDGMEFVI